MNGHETNVEHNGFQNSNFEVGAGAASNGLHRTAKILEPALKLSISGATSLHEAIFTFT